MSTNALWRYVETEDPPDEAYAPKPCPKCDGDGLDTVEDGLDCYYCLGTGEAP